MGRIRDALRRRRRARAFQKQLRGIDPLRLIIGAGGTDQSGWLATEQSQLDLLQPDAWQRFIQRDSVAAILAEHVWEHLTMDQGLIAAKTCYAYLQPGGYLRCAVPDGNHPSPDYIENVRPGGSGAGADDHHVLYTHATLEALLADAGFVVQPLEYFDDTGVFHGSEWNPDDGMVRRSIRFDRRNKTTAYGYTSLIVDAIKPVAGEIRRAA